VLSDTLHKAGFQFQQHILMQLIGAAETGMLPEVAPKQKVMEYLFDLFTRTFPTLNNRTQVEALVLNLFNKCQSPLEFQTAIRDFLIQLKEWTSHSDCLYEAERKEALAEADAREQRRRMQIPGLVPQYDPARTALEADMDDV